MGLDGPPVNRASITDAPREFANYGQDARRGYFDDQEFGNMLRVVVAGGVPQESLQPALRLLVARNRYEEIPVSGYGLSLPADSSARQ